jgi:hypothetical protein
MTLNQHTTPKRAQRWTCLCGYTSDQLDVIEHSMTTCKAKKTKEAKR